MRRAGSTSCIGLAAVFMVLLCPLCPVRAGIVLRYAPQDTTIDLLDSSSLSVHLDDAVDFRTIDLKVEYDPGILTTISGEHGALFDPFTNLWENFEEESPGHWYGYTIILGANDWGTGPGELYVWHFTGSMGGIADVITTRARLYGADGDTIADVSLPPTTVRVFDPSGTAVPPAPDRESLLEIAPNPFNPSTEVFFQLPVESWARLRIYTLTGRPVRTLVNARLAAKPHAVLWDGTDDRGRNLASGTYLVCLMAQNRIISQTITLLK